MNNCFSNKNEEFEKNFLKTITGLQEYQINNIKIRYISLVNEYRNRCKRYDTIYHHGRFIANVSSVLVPALLSIQFTGVNNPSHTDIDMIAVFWLTWILSLIVTVLNNTIGIFRIEKKYYLLHIILSQLISEGAQYGQLTGRYSGFLIDNGVVPSHSNQFVFFVHAVERIIMRETDIEYFRLYDGNNNLNILNRQEPVDSGKQTFMRKQLSHAGQALYHPSPEHPITAEKTVVKPSSPSSPSSAPSPAYPVSSSYPLSPVQPPSLPLLPLLPSSHPVLSSTSSTSSDTVINMLINPDTSNYEEKEEYSN